MSERKRIIVDVANLSIHAKKFIRTGIQEVVYKTLLSLVDLRHELEEKGDYELILLPQLPRRFGNLIGGSTTVPFQNPAKFILESIEEHFRLPSEAIWGFDLKAQDYALTDEQLLNWIEPAHAIHIQSMVNVGPLMEKLTQVRSPAVSRLSMTIYDLVPVLFPEYCDFGLARWFQGTYLPAIGKYVSRAVCISRNTAMDLMQNPLTRNIPHVDVLPLPFELALAPKVEKEEEEGREKEKKKEKLQLGTKDYLVFLGSLEPRKNFEVLLAGFETFRQLNPIHSSMKLVLVGATGWKNFKTERRIRNSPVAGDIIRAGYIPDDELRDLIQGASAMVMVSQYEGYGLPVAQAYSLGTPVITTLGSSLPEACGGEGIFVEPHDPWSIAAGIQWALETKGATRVNEAIRIQRDLSEWNWQGYARQLLELMISDHKNGVKVDLNDRIR